MNFSAISLSSLAVFFLACSSAPEEAGTPPEVTYPLAAGECAASGLTVNGVLGDGRVVVIDKSYGVSRRGSWKAGTTLTLSGSQGSVVGLELTGDLTTSPSAAVFGWLAIPDDAQKDAGAFYCAGPASTLAADTSPSASTVRADLAALTRLGTCDEAGEDLPGEVTGCMGGFGEKSGCKSSFSTTIAGSDSRGYSMGGGVNQISVADASDNVKVVATLAGGDVKRAVLFLHSKDGFTLACARNAAVTPVGDGKRFSFSGFKKLGRCGPDTAGTAGSMLICKP